MNLATKKYMLIGAVILVSVGLFYNAKKKMKPALKETPVKVVQQQEPDLPFNHPATEAPMTLPAAKQSLKANPIPDIADVKEQNQFLKSISKAGRGLVNIDGHETLMDCEKILWKNFKVQGLCQKAGSCSCRDPKVCSFGACFIAMDPLPENKKPVYLIRHLYRSFVGLEPGLKLISEMRSLSCLDAIQKIGGDRLVLETLQERNLAEKLNYYSKALWGRVLTEDEQLDLTKKLIPLKFNLDAYIKVFSEVPETKSVCSRWKW